MLIKSMLFFYNIRHILSTSSAVLKYLLQYPENKFLGACAELLMYRLDHFIISFFPTYSASLRWQRQYNRLGWDQGNKEDVVDTKASYMRPCALVREESLSALHRRKSFSPSSTDRCFSSGVNCFGIHFTDTMECGIKLRTSFINVMRNAMTHFQKCSDFIHDNCRNDLFDQNQLRNCARFHLTLLCITFVWSSLRKM